MKTNILTLATLVCVVMSCEFAGLRAVDTDLACTKEIQRVLIFVTDENNVTQELNSTFTILNSNQDTLRSETNPNLDQNMYYTVITDTSKKLLPIGEAELTFHGYIGSNLVLSEDYIVNNDGCHIIKIEGKDHVVIN